MTSPSPEAALGSRPRPLAGQHGLAQAEGRRRCCRSQTRCFQDPAVDVRISNENPSPDHVQVWHSGVWHCGVPSRERLCLTRERCPCCPRSPQRGITAAPSPRHLSAGRHRADRVALPWQSSPGKPRGVELTKRRCSLAFLWEAGWLGPGIQMGSDGPSDGLCPGGRDPERRRLRCGEVRAPASLQEASEPPALDQKDPKVSGSSS